MTEFIYQMYKARKAVGDKVILDDVTLSFYPGAKIGVVGPNGMGKSTLLKVMAGLEEVSNGEARLTPGYTVGILLQEPPLAEDKTVLENIQMAFADVLAKVERFNQIGEEMAAPDADFDALMDEMGKLQDEIDTAGGWDLDSQLSQAMDALQCPDPDAPVSVLSGGERRRVALCRLLLEQPDLLLLDEPTNHLDAAMIGWLESYLQGYTGGILLVTHDRYFLERVAERTVEVSFGKLYVYPGGYSAYLDGKARREEMEAASERKRQATLRRELQWVLQGPCARGTKSRERLERYERLRAAQPPETEGTLEPIRALSSRLGKKTVELHGVSKAFDGKQVLRDFDFQLQRTDRVGIVGGNGAGKSTLLNLIAGYLTPDSGTVTLGDTVKLGYFSQHAQELDPNMTALDYVRERGERIETPEGVMTASKLMDTFLFSGPLQHRLIGKLSGGEKRRLFLLGILASAPNVLLLDEPTNDLDIPTMTVLENYLETFPGAIIAVSHDRYFLDRLCHRIFAVEPGGEVKQYPGGYTDYLQSLDTPREKKPKAAPEPPRPRQRKLKFSFREQREFETIDDEIAALEGQLAENQRCQERDGADYEKLQALMQEQKELEAALEEKTERWLYLTDLAERIEKGE